MSWREKLRIFWHTRPGHSFGLFVTRGGVYCQCGARLNDG